MPDADIAKHIEDAAAALDTYGSRVISSETITHRQSPLLATTLIRALINDLGRYADQARVDIDAILSEVVRARAEQVAETPTRDHPYRIGSEVELKQDTSRAISASAHGRRGFVTAIEEPTDYGEPVYLVRFPGIPAGEFHLTASALEPAKAPFPAIATRAAIIRSAAQAEQNLITVAARVQQATRTQRPVDLADVTDRALLAETLGQWTGTTGERVLFSVSVRVERAAAQLNRPLPESAKGPSPAALAKADFPRDINDGVPTADTNRTSPQTTSISDRPRRQP